MYLSQTVTAILTHCLTGNDCVVVLFWVCFPNSLSVSQSVSIIKVTFGGVQWCAVSQMTSNSLSLSLQRDTLMHMQEESEWREEGETWPNYFMLLPSTECQFLFQFLLHLIHHSYFHFPIPLTLSLTLHQPLSVRHTALSHGYSQALLSLV